MFLDGRGREGRRENIGSKHARVTHKQCDQIWQKFATLAKKKFVWSIFDGYFLVLGSISILSSRISYALWQIFIVVNGQILNK